MTRRLVFPHLLAWFFAVPLAGCFTGPINRRPSVQLTPPATSIMRGKDASFIVVATDPDGDPLNVSWGVAGECPADGQSWQGDQRPLGAGERQVVVEGSATLGPFCVCVFAVDSHNATDANCLKQTPVDRAPDIKLRVVEPTTLPTFPLFSRVRISAAGTVDPDAAAGELIHYDWLNLERPTGSVAVLEACAPPAELDRCFTADAPGTYRVILEAADGMGEKSMAMVPVEIAADRLPCISETTPALTSLIRDDSHDAPRSISVVEVKDDGNPYPASSSGRIQFTWFAGLEGGPMIYLGNDFESFTPVGYQLGDVVRVRVEIRDRNVKTIDDILTRCQMSGDALCESPPGTGCFLSATWTVRFNL